MNAQKRGAAVENGSAPGNLISRPNPYRLKLALGQVVVDKLLDDVGIVR